MKIIINKIIFYNFSRSPSIYICVKKLREAPKLSKYWSLKETGKIYKAKVVYNDNTGKLMEENKEIMQKRKGPKNFHICFSVIFSYCC